MRAASIVLRLCGLVSGLVDGRRISLIAALVEALVRNGRLGLTALGRALDSAAAVKHRIKRVDRLLGSARAQREVPAWYGALARRVLAQNRRPILLLDWTKSAGSFYALVAAVAFQGRALPIFAEVHASRLLGNPRVQERFLASLAQVLPPDTKPILVADAGFKTPFFNACLARGWDFVIRLRGACALLKPDWRRTIPFAAAFEAATSSPRDLGRCVPYAKSLWPLHRVILGAKPTKQKRSWHDPYRRRAIEPWLLATTLEQETPRVIVSIYAKRMQIEETFRDAKNARFGWALEHARSHNARRQDILFLIACLALAAALLAGAAAEDAQLSLALQANSVRNRRVLSLFRVGAWLLAESTAAIPLGAITKQRQLLARYVHHPLQLRLPLTRKTRGSWR